MKSSIPTKCELSATLAKLLDSRARMHRSKDPLIAEAAKIRARVAAGDGIVGVGTDITDRAAQLLGEQTDNAALKSDRVQLAELHVELEATNRAIAILTDRISLEDRNANQSVLAQVKPQYAQAVSELCDAMIAVNRANRSYYAITDSLNDDGVNWCSLNPMAPLFLGNPKDNYSPVACFLHEAVEHGYFEKSKLPKELSR